MVFGRMPRTRIGYGAHTPIMARRSAARRAADGSGSLVAYAALLLAVAGAAMQRDAAHEDDLVDDCVRAWLRASGFLLVAAAALKGVLVVPPVFGHRRRRASAPPPSSGAPDKSPPAVARVLLACLGVGFVARAVRGRLDAVDAHDVAVQTATGAMAFLGGVALLLAGVTGAATARVGAFVDDADAVARRRRLLSSKRRTPPAVAARRPSAPGSEAVAVPGPGTKKTQ
mmetsp:Transcript_12639/g.50777  ORF Transcript_12639/g.50777 Transcript_12639/m.50777 type:complete len:228 (+) Transcript_12639:189-872(+)